MFDKMRKGAFLLMLAGLAVTLTGSPAGAASSQPAVSTAIGDRVAAPAAPWDADWDAPQVILYNQYDNLGLNAITSQNFEAAYDAYDGFGADDFVVPANTAWSIKGVGIDGVYYGCVPPACGPAASFNVFIHQDDGTGLPKDPPKVTRANMAYVLNGASQFRIMVSPPVNIPASASPRHVWVSVQANLDFAVGGQFGWTIRTVQSNDPAAWKNPGNGFGTGCTTWSNMSGCVAIPEPDFGYLLVGTSTP